MMLFKFSDFNKRLAIVLSIDIFRKKIFLLSFDTGSDPPIATYTERSRNRMNPESQFLLLSKLPPPNYPLYSKIDCRMF